jgi:cytochrome c553
MGSGILIRWFGGCFPPVPWAVVRAAMATAVCAAAWTPDASASPSDLFEQRIRPLLVEKCQACHGEKLAEAGLRLDSRAGLLAGSDSGAVVVPGDTDASRLISAVRHAGDLAMPPDARLSDEEIRWLETWVATGAAWEAGEPADTPVADRREALAARIAQARAEHWAFSSPVRHEPPLAAAAAGRIDRFVAAGLAAVGLDPAPPADPRTLVRRLWFDLTGLPPPANAVDAFAAAPTEQAYRSLVERLLASPECAEHWARKWLDIARYADSPGYQGTAVARPRYPFAWTYRDWVVRSLEHDLPLDRFIILQLAADHCQPGGRGADLAASPADLAALGFLPVGRRMAEHDVIDDAIDVVGRGLMGLTLACARCHDHKYEPVGIDDYYALHGVFASTTTPEDLPVIGPADAGPAGAAFAAQAADLRAAVTAHELRIRDRVVREAIAHAADYFLQVARPAPPPLDGRPPRLADGYELEPLIVDRMRRMFEKAGPDHPVLGPWAACAQAEDVPARLQTWLAEHPIANGGDHRLVAMMLAAEQPRSLAELAALYGRLAAEAAPEFAGGRRPAVDDPPDLVALRDLLGTEDTPLVPAVADALRMSRQQERERLNKLKADVLAHESTAPGGPPRAMVLQDRPQPVDSHVFLRGDPRRAGPLVERRLPVILGGAALPRDSSGRLELARAIVSADNPLTPRVLVNWAWTHHFGRGLVDTPGDLGLRGDPPLNRDLLDDLARRFVDDGRWSLRWLHREIVTSRTWRQSSSRRADLASVDPDDRLFGRALVRRLDWEPWRDALLAAAGTLDAGRRGGQPVEITAAEAATRRSIHLLVDRQFLPGLMRTFDMTATDICTHVRSRTLVPQQSLAVFNAPLVVEAARDLAARAKREAADAGDAAQARRLWRAALSRDPADDELAAAITWLEAERAAAPASQAADFGPWQRLAQAVLATAEFEHVD